jgi:signal recognition particle subunit SEC65
MTADEARSLYFLADALAEELAPEHAYAIRRRVVEWMYPRLDWEARMRILIETDARDLREGRAILVADDDGQLHYWTGQDQR